MVLLANTDRSNLTSNICVGGTCKSATLTPVYLNHPLSSQYCIMEVTQLPQIASLNDLVQELHRVFESDCINVEYVHNIMASYKSNPIEWKKFAKFDRYRYTRNLIDKGNGKFNLMLLCWGPSHTSTIHDHADAHCFMKMLSGSLQEVRFEWPKESQEETEEEQEMVEIDRNILKLNDVCYINDSLGLHRVENASHSEGAVSLHLYCPPFNCCSVFDERSGKKMKCPVTFWTEFGQRVEPKKSKSGC